MTSSADKLHPSSDEPLSEERPVRGEFKDFEQRERRLIAYELHDGLLQQIVGAKMMLEATVARVESGQPLEPGDLATVCKLLDAAIAEGRRLIGGLRPLMLDEEGIVPAIEHLIREGVPLKSAKIRFTHDLKRARYTPSLENALFRITQESLSNVARHSKATAVEISLNEEPDRIRLLIRDNGVGFEPAHVPLTRFGIRGITERAQVLGGSTSIESAPARGTTVMVELPLETPPSR